MTETAPQDAAIIVYCTCPDEATGKRLGQMLVKQGLAACVNLIPGVTSIYQWQGEIEQASECQLLIKTRRANFAALERALVEQHPYELPEIVAVPIQDAHTPYLNWIHACSNPDSTA